MKTTLTTDRIALTFRRMGAHPARFSRLAERLARVAGDDGRVWALSRACTEQRHMLLCIKSGDLKGAAQHSKRVGEEVRRATW